MIKYFKDQICEELEGACSYAKKAIEIKPLNLSWSRSFLEMSSAELTHANNLYKMAQEYYGKIADGYSEIPDYVKDIYEFITGIYTNEYSKVKTLHDMYNK